MNLNSFQNRKPKQNKTMETTLPANDISTINDIVMRQLDIAPEQITSDAYLEKDLGADSLDIVEIGMALEDKFSLSIPDELMEKVETVGDVYEAVAKLSGPVGQR